MKSCSRQRQKRIFIKKKAQLRLQGIEMDYAMLASAAHIEMDYAKDKLSSESVFNNPNIKERYSCGKSFYTGLL